MHIEAARQRAVEAQTGRDGAWKHLPSSLHSSVGWYVSMSSSPLCLVQTCIFKNSFLEGLEESSEAAASVGIWEGGLSSVLVDRSVGNLVWARMPGVEPRAVLVLCWVERSGAWWYLV